MVADNAWYVHVPLTGLVTCQQVVQAMAHLAYEDGHAWTLVIKVKDEGHAVPLRV